jgi:hypothetical protein
MATKGKGGASGHDGGDNVHMGPGSKSGSTGKARTGGETVDGADGGSAGFHSGTKTSADATEKTHNVEFAKGGDTKMFGEQAAGSRNGQGAEGTVSDKSPSTGKPDSSGPGAKFAGGGSGKMFGYNPAKPATAGITSAY